MRRRVKRSRWIRSLFRLCLPKRNPQFKVYSKSGFCAAASSRHFKAQKLTFVCVPRCFIRKFGLVLSGLAMSEETGAPVCEDAKDKSPFHILLFLFEKVFRPGTCLCVYREKQRLLTSCIKNS